MQAKVRSHPRISSLLVLLLAYAALVALYWIVRYGSWAIEGDATRMGLAAEGIFTEGRLIPGRAAYIGYGYPVQVAFLSHLTGISIQAIQLNTGIWLFVLSLTAFICYRELLGQTVVAVLATLLLLLQPDFSFYILRGSHEKTIWLYALLLLFSLARSYRFAQTPARLVVYVLLFYLVFWGMVTTNAYLASTFVTALALSFASGWRLTLWHGRSERQPAERAETIRRLLIISLACFTIVFIFVNYVYSPAIAYYRTLSSLLDRLSTLFLGAQPWEPYTYLETAWRSPALYLILTGAQWMIAISGLIAWVLEARRLLHTDQKTWLLWLMYAGFGVQLAFAVVVDFAGFLTANLQVRLFTPFTLFTSPLAAGLIFSGYQRLSATWRRVAVPAVTALVTYAVVAALLKVTNDPLVGNQWIFYSPSELSATQWTDKNLQYQRIWVDTFPHQVDVLAFWEGYAWQPRNTYDVGRREPPAPYILLSRLTRLQANRSALSLPATIEQNRVYDNGDVQLYHRRPQTPYQR